MQAGLIEVMPELADDLARVAERAEKGDLGDPVPVTPSSGSEGPAGVPAEASRDR